jgi:glycosyltransferase involved in cell wall biosynthesis
VTAVSVVVATYNRAPLIHRIVEAIERQDFDGEVELIVVDDASPDDTWHELQRLAAGATIPMQVLQLPANRGPATARNLGWRAATAKHIVFTDDDCIPSTGWVRGLTDALHTTALAQGATLPNPDQLANSGPFSRTLVVRRETGYYPTCNMAYRRDTLERLGGFDERFRNPAGEDTDLAWRALDSGAACTFVADAVVHHDVRSSNLMTQLRDTVRWEGVVLAVREHPNLRAKLHRRWFWKPSHPPAIAAAIGLVATVATKSPVVRVAALAMLAPYAAYRLHQQPIVDGAAQRLAYLPAALVADLGEVGVCAWASARYGTVLL